MRIDLSGLSKRIKVASATDEIRMGYRPHPKQQEILDALQAWFDDPTKARFFTVFAGRRTGKTMCATEWAVRLAHHTKGVVWWIAPTYQASTRAMRDMLKLLPRRYRRWHKSERRIELLSGGCIEFKSADNPDALRGEGLAGYVADEAAYIDSYVFTDVLDPMMLTTQGPRLLISTPKTKSGFMYEEWKAGIDGGEDGQPLAAYHSWQMPTSVNPYVPAAEIERLRQRLPEQTFAREIMAQALDSLNNPLSAGVEQAVLLQGTPVVGSDYRMGIDWGRVTDFTVCSVLRVTGDGTADQVDLLRFTGKRYKDQLAEVKAFVAKWNPTVIKAETNNMGDPLVEALQEDGLPIEGFFTSASSKEPLIRQLQLALETPALRLLKDDTQTAELRDYEEETEAGDAITTFGAPDRGHDDTVMALALAWRAYDGEPGGELVGSFGDLEDHLVRASGAPALPKDDSDDPQYWI